MRAAASRRSAAGPRAWAALAGALALALLPAAPARANPWEIGFDLVVLRPLNAAAVAVGAGFFAIAYPLVAPFEEEATAFEIFVYAPYEYTFLRDLGDF